MTHAYHTKFVPQSFLANSVPAAIYHSSSVCIQNSTRQWNQTRALPLRMRKTQQRTHWDVTTDKFHSLKINLYERDAGTNALSPKNPLIFDARVNWPYW